MIGSPARSCVPVPRSGLRGVLPGALRVPPIRWFGIAPVIAGTSEVRPHRSRPHRSRPHLSRPHRGRPHLSRPHLSRPHLSRPHRSRPRRSRSSCRLLPHPVFVEDAFFLSPQSHCADLPRVHRHSQATAGQRSRLGTRNRSPSTHRRPVVERLGGVPNRRKSGRPPRSRWPTQHPGGRNAPDSPAADPKRYCLQAVPIARRDTRLPLPDVPGRHPASSRRHRHGHRIQARLPRRLPTVSLGAFRSERPRAGQETGRRPRPHSPVRHPILRRIRRHCDPVAIPARTPAQAFTRPCRKDPANHRHLYAHSSQFSPTSLPSLPGRHPPKLVFGVPLRPRSQTVNAQPAPA